MEVELMVTKRDDNRQPTTDDDDDRVNIEQSASGRLEGRVLQYKYVRNTNTNTNTATTPSHRAQPLVTIYIMQMPCCGIGPILFWPKSRR